MSLTYGSVCSGIESASVAWGPLGMRPLWFSEIEPFPSSVLAERWPDMPNMGDFTRLREYLRIGLVECPDILVGGTPCQAFSVTGAREGLADERGNLTLEFAKLANELKESTVVWENVPGVLSSKDNAFGCFLGMLAGEDEPLIPSGPKWTNAGYVLGPERAIAWRVLDAQYFGVAQRRRRVFVVGCPRGGADPREILFESEGVRRDSPPSREAGQDAAGNAGPNTYGSIGLLGDTTPKHSEELMPTLRAEQGGEGRCVAFAENSRAELRLEGGDGSRTGCISGQGGKVGQGLPAACTPYGVRRLTPIECERLQGFPDNHTLVDHRGKPAKDGPRYKAIGNSKAVPVVQWLGRRLLAAL